MKNSVRPTFNTWRNKPYAKPLLFAHRKWQTFRSYSRKKQLAILGGTTALVLILIPIFSYLYFVRDINDPERLMNRNNTGIVIADKNDEVIYSFGRTANDKIVRLDQISDNMEQALIASEDKNFYEHNGFSLRSIGGALIANVLNRDMTKYGGSTITQQLVKNNLLTNNKSILRKYQELSIAIAVERSYTKDEILEMYLNSVYYGEGAFGIEQAAKTYFGKSPQDLTLAESSVLVGILPAPSAYSPISGDPELAKEQQERVLTEMVAAGYIEEADKAAVLSEALAYANTSGNAQEYAFHFTQMIMAELRDRYGEEQVTRSGFRVKSTLDLGAQKNAEQTIQTQIARNRSQGATNASLVAIDPKTGGILALVGSVDWSNPAFGQVNMATTPRQPGSSFKPIYYAEALDQRLITPATVIRDERKVYGGNYQPENYDRRFRGDITVRHALATSLNIPAIEVMQKLGVAESVKAAQRMGISTVANPERHGLSLALGTAETKLTDMTNAYAAFANGGLQHPMSGITSIENKYGKVIYTNKSKGKQVQSPQASYLISNILADNNARAPLFGGRLNVSGRQVAVKTGTTNDNKDAWTIGYTPSVAVGVWVGDNTHQPMQVGGGAAAGPIWRSTIQHILGKTKAEQFTRPKGIVEVGVCTVDGRYYEVFIAGTAPKERCHIPTQAEIEAEEKRKKEEEEEKKRLEKEAEKERKRLEEEAEAEREEAEQDTETDGEDTTDEETEQLPDGTVTPPPTTSPTQPRTQTQLQPAR